MFPLYRVTITEVNSNKSCIICKISQSQYDWFKDKISEYANGYPLSSSDGFYFIRIKMSNPRTVSTQRLNDFKGKILTVHVLFCSSTNIFGNPTASVFLKDVKFEPII